ncbi:MAG: hypothetical protein H0W95_05850 [Nocardioidaceae bacterium]|nr:hypothetical protein [Nocardioidaceae bacterium]
MADNVFSDHGESHPVYLDSQPSVGVHNQAASSAGEHITFQPQTFGPKVGTIDVYSAHRGAPNNDCHVQAQAVVTRAP